MGQGEINDGQNGENALQRGIALFNAGDFFHAHEVWEDWWRATTRPEKQTIQGMIQIAVAMHHATTGNSAGAISVMERGLQNLEVAGDAWRGVNLQLLRAEARLFIKQLKSAQTLTIWKIATSPSGDS